MFCENCGAEIPDGATFCSSCGSKVENKIVKSAKSEKNMILALIISFILTGLGIAYAGNMKKGIVLFVVGLIFNILGFGIPICSVIGILIWLYGMYETYNEVKRANGDSNPNLLEDWQGFDSNKKIGTGIVAAVILLIAIVGIFGAFSPHDNSSHDSSSSSLDTSSPTLNTSTQSVSSSSSSSDSSSSSSGSSSSDRYSSSSSNGDVYTSSSDGRNVESHYEGEYGSSDTHGTVYDDGSVEAHETGHTEYGDYKIDSYMDSNGNVHGTVEMGGETYYVDY